MADDKPDTIVTTGRWTASQLTRAVLFLDAVAANLRSTAAEDIATGLRVLILGRAPFVPSCTTCSDVESKYSVLCADCATHLGPATPQKMIFKLSEGGVDVWAACSFSTVFVPKVYGKPNTIEQCEELLEGLDTEAAVEGMIEMLNAGEPKEGEYKQ